MTDTTFDAFTPPAGAPAVPIPPPATGGYLSAEDQVYVPEHPAPFVVPASMLPVAAQGTVAAVPDGAHVMPSGNWVRIGDAHLLTRGDKRDLIRASDGATTMADRIFIASDLLLTRLITAWSYPLPIPSQDAASLDRLPVEDDDAITELIAEANVLLFPRPATPDDHADPASPTGPSGE